MNHLASSKEASSMISFHSLPVYFPNAGLSPSNAKTSPSRLQSSPSPTFGAGYDSDYEEDLSLTRRKSRRLSEAQDDPVTTADNRNRIFKHVQQVKKETRRKPFEKVEPSRLWVDSNDFAKQRSEKSRNQS
jgi:hypothetical protein